MAAEGAPAADEQPRRRTLVWVAVAIVTVIWAWTVYSLIGVDVYKVPSESMKPTYEVGTKVVVDTGAYDDSEPELSDVAVFHPPIGAELANQCGERRPSGAACPAPTPERSDIEFIKRIVAVPGDRLRFEGGVPIVNGTPVAVEFLAPCQPGGECTLPVEITIPPDHYFTLGDNVGESDDSRFWGPVPRESLIGKVTEETGPIGLPGSFPLVLFIPLLLIIYLGSLVVAAMKRRWLLFVIGLFVIPVAVLGAALRGQPGSYWERRKA